MTYLSLLPKKMDKIIKTFFEKMVSVNTVILFTSSKNTVGFRHKRVETLYKQAQSIKLDILRSSQDSDMHGVYNVIMEKSSNWSKKFSASAEWQRLIKFFSYTEAIGRVEVFTIFHFATRKFTIFHLIFCCFLVVKSRENV